MSSPRVYFRCMYCRRRVMAPRDPVQVRYCRGCRGRSVREAFERYVFFGTYPRRPRPECDE